MESDLASEQPVDRQRAVTADRDRNADQHQVEPHLHAAVWPKLPGLISVIQRLSAPYTWRSGPKVTACL
jgi:hypothetical protein